MNVINSDHDAEMKGWVICLNHLAIVKEEYKPEFGEAKIELASINAVGQRLNNDKISRYCMVCLVSTKHTDHSRNTFPDVNSS